ncbi:MAG: hypothetical protein AB7V44_21340, partial [Pseudonocardia sp.]
RPGGRARVPALPAQVLEFPARVRALPAIPVALRARARVTRRAGIRVVVPTGRAPVGTPAPAGPSRRSSTR